MSRTAFILDGYVDEPACLGVPPYMSPYIRTVAGALLSHNYTVRYLTIDQLRKEPMRTADLNGAGLMVMIAGVTVPGKYRSARLLSPDAVLGAVLVRLSSMIRPSVRVLTGLGAASCNEFAILVGHSLGAFNVMIFAWRYPEDVAGLVLLDPPPLSFALGREYKELGAMAAGMTAQWEAIADSASKSADPRDKARAAYFRAIASEHREMFGPSAKLVEGIATLGDIPLVVIAAGKANPNFGPIAEEYQKYWIGQSRALTSKSTKAKFVIAPESSHYLYLDAPELVAENILSLVK